MSIIIIKLQGLPLEANSLDVRRLFSGLKIPDGGVHIVGGDEGAVFIEFANDEDARQAMSREMQTVIDAARQRQQQFFRQQQQQLHHQQQLQQQTQQQHRGQPFQQQVQHNHQIPYLTTSNHVAAGNNTVTVTSSVTPMGPAMLLQQQSPQHPQQAQVPPCFDGDPRMMSQNYQGIVNVIGQQQQQQQTQNLQHPTFENDPRFMSQNYQGLITNVLGQQQQHQLSQHQQQPTPFLGDPRLLSQNPNLDVPNAQTIHHVQQNQQHNINQTRMSTMRGGDDKLFANKRCVLAASNIPYRATSKDIIEFLSEFNIKEDCIRRRYNQKGQPTADAKIAFPTPDAAIKAMKSMNKKKLCGRTVFLKPV